MEYPRPSPNFGKFTSTRATRSSRPATVAGSSVGSRRSTSPSSGEGALCGTMRRPLIRVAIDTFLEGLDANALHHVDEALHLAIASLEIALDQALDYVWDVGPREGRAEHLAERSADAGANFALIAADL